jgi:hypothetical protein
VLRKRFPSLSQPRVAKDFRLWRRSGHQNPGKRARCSASGGYPGTKAREGVPAAPPQRAGQVREKCRPVFNIFKDFVFIKLSQYSMKTEVNPDYFCYK